METRTSDKSFADLVKTAHSVYKMEKSEAKIALLQQYERIYELAFRADGFDPKKVDESEFAKFYKKMCAYAKSSKKKMEEDWENEHMEVFGKEEDPQKKKAKPKKEDEKTKKKEDEKTKKAKAAAKAKKQKGATKD